MKNLAGGPKLPYFSGSTVARSVFTGPPRALWGARCRRFKSCRPDLQKKPCYVGSSLPAMGRRCLRETALTSPSSGSQKGCYPFRCFGGFDGSSGSERGCHRGGAMSRFFVLAVDQQFARNQQFARSCCSSHLPIAGLPGAGLLLSQTFIELLVVRLTASEPESATVAARKRVAERPCHQTSKSRPGSQT